MHLAIALFILCTQYLCRAHAIVLNLSGATQNCTFCGFRCSQLFVRFVASMYLKVNKSESSFFCFCLIIIISYTANVLTIKTMDFDHVPIPRKRLWAFHHSFNEPWPLKLWWNAHKRFCGIGTWSKSIVFMVKTFAVYCQPLRIRKAIYTSEVQF